MTEPLAEILPLKETVPSHYVQDDRTISRDSTPLKGTVPRRFARSDNTNKAGRRWKDSQESGRGAVKTLPPHLASPPQGGEEYTRNLPRRERRMDWSLSTRPGRPAET